MNAAIVDHREGVNYVRYEFDTDYGPDTVLAKVKDALADLTGIRGVNIDEHNDKHYYFIIITFRTEPGQDWREKKSQILMRLIAVQRSLPKANLAVDP